MVVEPLAHFFLFTSLERRAMVAEVKGYRGLRRENFEPFTVLGARSALGGDRSGKRLIRLLERDSFLVQAATEELLLKRAEAEEEGTFQVQASETPFQDFLRFIIEHKEELRMIIEYLLSLLQQIQPAAIEIDHVSIEGSYSPAIQSATIEVKGFGIPDRIDVIVRISPDTQEFLKKITEAVIAAIERNK